MANYFFRTIKDRVSWVYVLLPLITTIVFFCTFSNDFQYNWDHQWMLLEQPFVTDFSWYSMKFHFLNFYHGQYSPINTLLYQLIYSLFGLNAGAYHASCLVLLSANRFWSPQPGSVYFPVHSTGKTLLLVFLPDACWPGTACKLLDVPITRGYCLTFCRGIMEKAKYAPFVWVCFFPA